MVDALSFSVFSTYYKSAIQLKAREGLDLIQFTNFSDYKTETREKISRTLVQASTAFEEKKIKDYREVLANLARGLSGGGR